MPGVLGSLEPEPLEKTGARARAGAALKKSQDPELVKKLAGYSAMRKEKCTFVTLLKVK